jgi:hypothetical protein
MGAKHIFFFLLLLFPESGNNEASAALKSGCWIPDFNQGKIHRVDSFLRPSANTQSADYKRDHKREKTFHTHNLFFYSLYAMAMKKGAPSPVFQLRENV